ncbi:hypothetical protein ACFCYI_08165 [Streptomyces sp. NPDC056257]|uniref:hypothetical protein n=1 Tax=Streptomyces sp. NPDC056257 TaxID=3345765 RepID=UPI0035E1FD64
MQNPYQQPNEPGALYQPPLPQPTQATQPPQAPQKRTNRLMMALTALMAVGAIAAVTAVIMTRDEQEGPPDPSKPLVAGWKTVVNPKYGTAFDVPPDWEVLSPDVFSGHGDDNDPDKILIGHTAPAFYKSEWCSIDADGDGTVSDFALGSVGTKGAEGAKDTTEVAEKNAPTWVYAAYTQPDKSVVKWDKPVEYTTKFGLKGTYVKAHSEGAKQPNRCAGDGHSIVFAFKNAEGAFAAWDFYGRTGVPGAIPDSLIMRILSTVRLTPTTPTTPTATPTP